MQRKLKAGKRHSGGFSLNVFTDDEVHEIHLATMEVLKNTGVFVEDEEAMEVFDGGGCVADKKTRLVHIPPYVVEDAIRSAPGTFVACGRTPDSDIVLEHRRVSFTNFGEGIMFVDPYTGEHRKSVKADTEKAAKLIDSLENIGTYERAMCSHDKPHQVQALHNAEASLLNTTKHHWLGPQDGYLARKIVEILAAIVGGRDRLRERPLLTFVTCPISPLKLVKHHCEIIMEAAKNGLGVNIVGMAMAGGSSPVHLAGTLILQNCEILSSLVLNQLTCRGSPFVYGSSTCPLDLRTATSSVGSPELGMISAGVARLAQYYQLPCFVAGG
jgi:trimethylamine--corrinoid protein Co-methyltransferase